MRESPTRPAQRMLVTCWWRVCCVRVLSGVGVGASVLVHGFGGSWGVGRRGECGQAALLLLGVVAALLLGLARARALRPGARCEVRAISARRTWRRCRRRWRCATPIRGCSSRRGSRTGRRTRATCRCLRTWRARGHGAARRPRNGVKLRAADVTLPGRLVRAHAREGGRPRRACACAWTAGGRGRRPGARERDGRAGPVERRRRSAGPAAASGGGYDGPLAYRMGKGDAPRRGRRLRPHGRRRPQRRPLPLDHQRLPLRRRAGAPVRGQPEPEVGGAARHQPAPLRHRARPRPARPPTPGSPPTPAPSASSTATPGSPGTTAIGANPRDREHPAQYERGSWEPPGGDHGRIHHRLPSFVPPRFQDPIARGGPALERADGAARRTALRGVRLQPVRRERRGRARDRAVHARHRAGVRAGRPATTRSRRSTPRRT